MEENHIQPMNNAYPTSQQVTLPRAELRAMFEFFDLTTANKLSYLPYLCNVPGGQPQLVESISNSFPHLTKATAEGIFSPLLIPDRVIDVCSEMYGQAPSHMQLYTSRKAEHMIGVRSIDTDQIELTLPITISHVIGWLEGNLQFSGSLILPSLFGQFKGQQLAFLLALIDTYKQSFFQSHLDRLSQPVPIFLQIPDILKTDQIGRTQTDRRWLVTALREILIQLVHIGGAVQVEFPPLDENFVRQECLRYQKAGYLFPEDSTGKYKANTNLAELASDLSQWICIICLQDLQIIGGTAEKPEAVEEMVFFIATQTTIWTLVSHGLSKARSDLSEVHFGLRSSPLLSVFRFAKRFLDPLQGIVIPEDYYKRSIPLVKTSPEPASEQTEVVTITETPVARYCRYCGKPMPQEGDNRFCRYCGRQLS